MLEDLNIVGPFCLKSEKYLEQLQRPDLMRATTVTEVLSGFGSHFDSSAGDKADYDLSAQVSGFDLFLSHNWSADRRLKAMAILQALNLRAAVIASAVTALTIFALQWWRGPLVLEPCMVDGAFDSHFVPCFGIGGRLAPPFGSMYPATLVFFLVFFTAHRVRERVTQPLAVFFDKLCIRQVDEGMERESPNSSVRWWDDKREGIKAISAFLTRSDRFLLLWNEQYFGRMWWAAAQRTPSSHCLFTPPSTPHTFIHTSTQVRL